MVHQHYGVVGEKKAIVGTLAPYKWKLHMENRSFYFHFNLITYRNAMNAIWIFVLWWNWGSIHCIRSSRVHMVCMYRANILQMTHCYDPVEDYEKLNMRNVSHFNSNSLVIVIFPSIWLHVPVVHFPFHSNSKLTIYW